MLANGKYLNNMNERMNQTVRLKQQKWRWDLRNANFAKNAKFIYGATYQVCQSLLLLK